MALTLNGLTIRGQAELKKWMEIHEKAWGKSQGG